MIFRYATEKDIPAMSAIRLAVKENVLSDPHKVTLTMYKDYLQKLGRGWICECQNTIIGFSYADKTNDSIWALFVLPQHEGRGAGKVLLQNACNWLFESGAKKVTLFTGENTRADRFYKQLGWQRGKVDASGDVEFILTRPSRTQP